MVKKNIIVVCGPTASGKTSLAVEIARQFGGEILSADSRQVYRMMDLGTGKDLDEYSRGGCSIPYYLIDIADPQDMYTVYDYKKDFKNVYNEIRSKHNVPIMAGGSGLYIEAVLRNYDIPQIPENPQLREALMSKDKLYLQNELQRKAPDLYVKTDLNSKKRIVRSLEIATFRTSSDIERDVSFPSLEPVVLCTRWDRTELRKRIDNRLKKRLKMGMVEEVKKILETGISRSRFSLFGMEYKHIARYLDGEVTYENMVEELKISIHQLAKRQDTWFRGMERRGIAVHWVDNSDFDQAMSILQQFDFER